MLSKTKNKKEGNRQASSYRGMAPPSVREAGQRILPIGRDKVKERGWGPFRTKVVWSEEPTHTRKKDDEEAIRE